MCWWWWYLCFECVLWIDPVVGMLLGVIHAHGTGKQGWNVRARISGIRAES